MLNTAAELRKTNEALCRGKHNASLFYNPNQDARMAMQGDFECLWNNDGFKHTDIQIQRRSERHGRTPGFKDSNVNNLMTIDQTNIRGSLILNQIDATRFRSVCLGQRWIKTSWILLRKQNIWPMVQPMSELGEFVFVPKKLTVRDSVMQIGNNTSKSGASSQSRDSIECWEKWRIWRRINWKQYSKENTETRETF